MKKKQFIYLTTAFSLGINTFFGALFSQANAVSNNNYENSFTNNASLVDVSKENFYTTSDNWNLTEANNSLSWKAKNNFQIAQASNGKASWYGPKFHGRRTANGEVFNSNDLTAAHPSLPFGTKVKVTNILNGRSVIVRINDRGPFIKGRIIDVSAGAARMLNMINSGVATVQLEVLGR